jgi:hypothetical protein
MGDPETGRDAAIFNPRAEAWDDHFRWNGVLLVGKSPTGRATVEALALNRPAILAIRLEEEARGRHPPRTSGEGNGEDAFPRR